MESASEKSIIMESNRINPHPGEEFVGALLRRDISSKKWRAFVYAKKGIYLEEFRPSCNRLSDYPREIIDLTGVVVDDMPIVSGLTKNELQKTVKITSRNGKVLFLMASTEEEKNAWAKVLKDDEKSTENAGAKGGLQKGKSNITPIRRAQISIQDLKRYTSKKVARVECDPKGSIVRVNEVVEILFGYSAQELIGQNISILMPEAAAAKHEEYLTSPNHRGTVAAILGKYRNVQAKHQDGDEFGVQIRIEMTQDGNYLASIVDEFGLSGNDEVENPDEYKEIQNLRVKLNEAKNLAGENASKKSEKLFDPYCVVLIDTERKATTTTKQCTTNPFWGEEFFFDDIGNQAKILKVVINNQNKSSAKDPRHGQLVIDLKTHQHGRPVEKWYTIMPVRQETDSTSKSLGTMRVKATLISEKILPFQEYSELLDLILDDELTVFNALASVAGSQLEEIAGTLVNIYAMENRVIEFIHKLTIQEIHSTENVNIIFRANSLTTKVIDLYMKIVGLPYLHSVLTDLLSEVYADKESCEIDSTRLEKGDDLDANVNRLLIYVNRFFGAIAASVDKLPPEMACVFENIKNDMVQKWPENDVEKYISVSGFIFLRFFCPAILDPNLFGIQDEHPTGNTARTLTLIAKTMQNLANLVEAGVEKEPYMVHVNPFIKENMERMKSLINKFCKPSTHDPSRFGKVDQRNLRRELSALYRYFSERLEVLRENAKQNKKDEDEAAKVSQLFEAIEKLDERHRVYDVKNSSDGRRSLAIDPRLVRMNNVLYENKPHTPY